MPSQTSQTSSFSSRSSLARAAVSTPATLATRTASEARSRTRLSLTEEARNVDDIDDDVRQELGPRLHAIFCESYGALDLETVCDEIIFKTGGRLGLYRDQGGNLVGFTAARVERVEVAGRSRGIMGGGAYFRRGVSGGVAAIRFCLKLALGFKLRHPLTPLYYVCEALTPVSYRRIVRSLSGVWPRRDQEAAPSYARVLEAVLDQRGFARSADRPYVIRYSDPASHRQAGQVQTSASLKNDPDVHFYLAENPDFADGDILCSIVPLDFTDIARSVLANLTKTLRRTR